MSLIYGLRPTTQTTTPPQQNNTNRVNDPTVPLIKFLPSFPAVDGKDEVSEKNLSLVHILIVHGGNGARTISVAENSEML